MRITRREKYGNLCFFCSKEVSIEEQSIEHVIPYSHRIRRGIGYGFLAIAHRKCNQYYGNLNNIDLNFNYCSQTKQNLTIKPIIWPCTEDYMRELLYVANNPYFLQNYVQ